MEISPMQMLLIITLFFLFVIVKQWKKSKAHGQTPKLPPGPWKLPLLGNLHHLIGSPPLHTMRDLAKKHGPIVFLQLGEVSAIVISSPMIAEEVLKRHDLTFAQRPQYFSAQIMSFKDGSGMLSSPYGDCWRQLRKICLGELISAKRIQSFKSVRDEEVRNLIESIQSSVGTPINITKKMSCLVSNIACRVAIGNNCELDQDKFMSTLRKVIVGGGLGVPDMFPWLKFLYFVSGLKSKYEKLIQTLDMILDAIINKHRSDTKFSSTNRDAHKFELEENLVDVLLRIQDSHDLKIPITTGTIKYLISEMLGATTETSSATMEWAMSELMRNPRVMEKAQAQVRQALKGKSKIDEQDIEDLDYLKAIVKETLRLHPPVPLIGRESREKCEINGYDIPKNTMAIINVWAMCRDPTYWADADSFRPERFLIGGSSKTISFRGTEFEFIPFGAGRRMCPGISYASAIVELALAHLLYHFDWQLPNGTKPEELDMTDIFEYSLRRKNNLHLIPISFHSFV